MKAAELNGKKSKSRSNSARIASAGAKKLKAKSRKGQKRHDEELRSQLDRELAAARNAAAEHTRTPATAATPTLRQAGLARLNALAQIAIQRTGAPADPPEICGLSTSDARAQDRRADGADIGIE